MHSFLQSLPAVGRACSKRPTRHPCWALRILIPVRSRRPDAQHVPQGDSTHVGKAHHHENVEYLYTSLKQATKSPPPPLQLPYLRALSAPDTLCSSTRRHFSLSRSTTATLTSSHRSRCLRVSLITCAALAERSNRVWWLQAMSATDIEAKPFVLLIGQYSVGKTTFINHLLGDRPHGCDAPMLLPLLLASHLAWWLINLTLHRTIVERCATPCGAVDALLPVDPRPDETVRPPQVPRLQRGSRADD